MHRHNQCDRQERTGRVIELHGDWALIHWEGEYLVGSTEPNVKSWAFGPYKTGQLIAWTLRDRVSPT